jgi:hypothetical protein
MMSMFKGVRTMQEVFTGLMLPMITGSLPATSS